MALNMLLFILIGIQFALIVGIVQKKLKLHIKISITLLLILSIFFIIFLNTQPVKLGENSWYNKTPAKELILFLIMLLGIIARYFTKLIEERREKISELKKNGASFEKPKLEFDLYEFMYPIFISVITFGSLMSQIEIKTLVLSNIILSFQTGFFWQTLLSKKIND